MFRSRENYLFFLQKARRNILPNASIISYCLMPNHYHFLVTIKEQGAAVKNNMQEFSFAIGNLQSTYTQAINKQYGHKGALFAHKVRAKILNDAGNDYLLHCFMYIHQNPFLAGLVRKMEDWEFSSFPDYIGMRHGTLPDVAKGFEMLNIEPGEIYNLSYHLLQDKTDEDFL